MMTTPLSVRYLSALGGDGAVGRLADDLGLDVHAVVLVDGLLGGGRDEDVALHLHALAHTVSEVLATGEAEDGAAVVHAVLVQGGDVEAVGVVDGAVVLDDGGHLGAGLLEEVGGVVADVAKALDDDLLASHAHRHVQLVHDALVVAKVLHAEEHAHARRLRAALDAALGHGLARHAAGAVDVLGVEHAVL